VGSAAGLPAQDAAPTLHVYANLVQVPTLVLQQDRRPLAAPVAPGRFFVSFDGGPKFRATQARLEGDDPITLSILLDLQQPFPTLMSSFGAATAGLAPKWLTTKDHVSIYSADCDVVRSADDVPAGAEALRGGVAQGLHLWTLRGSAHEKQGCPTPANLWDSLAKVGQEMRNRPGRRVILVVSDGLDRGSKNSWDGVRDFARENGIAVFGLIQPADVFGAYHAGFPSSEDTFNALCEQTGGMVLVASENDLGAQLQQFTSLLRGRYIVEFPRPLSTTPGTHRMTITIDRMQAYVMPTGIGVPADDPAVLKAPTTVPVNPASVPQLGQGKAGPQ
jgi:hypothetical protein